MNTTLSTELYSEYLVEGKDSTYYALCLPFRFDMVIVNMHTGCKKHITKNVVNCITYKPCTWSIFTDKDSNKIGVAPTKLVTVKSGKPCVIEIGLQHHKRVFTTRIGNRYFEVLSIDGKSPLKFCPHLVDMLNLS